MQVFSERMKTRGGRPLPLSYYLQPTSASDAERTPPIDPFTTVLDGRRLQDALSSDSGFPVVTAFLLGGVDINARDKSGSTPLHIAVARSTTAAGDDDDNDPLSSECPNQMIISFLLDNGADLNGRNAAGETPLMIAAATQNLGALRTLLLKGADTMQLDDVGHTVLYHAARSSIVLQTLHAFISDFPRRCAQESLLHAVCRHGGCGAEFVILFLIEQLGIDVNAREGEATTTELVDHVSPITKSHESASSVTVRDGYTPLHCAVAAGDLAVVRLLLLKGSDVEKEDSVGMTPIQLAAGYVSSSSFLTRLYRSFLFKKQQQVCHGGSSLNPGNRPEIYKMLIAYRNEMSPSKREAMLNNSSAAEVSLTALNTYHDVMQFLGAALLPHVFLALVALTTDHFSISALFALICLLWCAVLIRRDSCRSNARPLRSLGFFQGYTIVLSVCCVSQARSTGLLHRYAYTTHCLLFFAVISAVCALLVICCVPEIAESTAAQRDGIYRAIFYSKGVLSEDLRHSIDVQCMVRKPLQAQRCCHLGRVVLRFDHYCTWLASSIGAGNHHIYVCFLIFFTCFLGGYWNCIGTWWPTRRGIPSLSRASISSSRLCFIDVYVTVVLPIVFVVFLLILLQQLWHIARGVTWYDVLHPSRCPWCFNLGSRTYSLFDAGFWENLRRFFFARQYMSLRTYRLPAISARLQQKVKNYHATQYSPCNSGHCHLESHDAHTHSRDPVLGRPEEHSGFVTSVGDGCAAADGPGVNGSSAAADGPMSDLKTASTRAFLLMVQSDSADVVVDDNMRTGFSSVEWQEVMNNARNMFIFFKNAKTSGSS